jgi:hypothetical protein
LVGWENAKAEQFRALERAAKKVTKLRDPAQGACLVTPPTASTPEGRQLPYTVDECTRVRGFMPHAGDAA